MNRVFRRVQEWEEIEHGMWDTVTDKKTWLRMAIKFTGNYELYGEYMLLVVDQWPVSCENSLTDIYSNRKAWIGHAAAALAFNCPEHVTREAWGYLTYEQRILANKKAATAIEIWEKKYTGKGAGIPENMGTKMLF